METSFRVNGDLQWDDKRRRIIYNVFIRISAYGIYFNTSVLLSNAF